MDVGAWLVGLGLGEHSEAFAENGVDATLLRELTNDDLKDLGVARLADRKRLLNTIAALSEGDGRSETHPSPAIPPEGELRQVTVLFADLSNFTPISNELGAEATHALLNRYFETVDGIVAGYGGTIDKHMGDNVMAVFGAPVAHTNDPERAVRSAIDIHAAMRGLSAEMGRPLMAHIGIASGQVVASGTGSEAHLEYTVTGNTVNLASRLQEHAKAGETLVSKPVQRATVRIVVSSSRGEVSVKGFANKVGIWTVEQLLSGPEFGRETNFVGRRMELRQFSALLEEVLKQGQGHSLLVRGEPGIGKTRLIEEFDSIARSEGLLRHKSLILDFGVARGQDAIRVLVASLLSVPMDNGVAGRQGAARHAITEDLVAEENRPFLHDLLDLPPPPETREFYDAMDNATRKQGTIETINQLIRSLCIQRPRLLLVEDIHWAEQGILDVLAGVATAVADVPALLVMTTRVEGLALEQSWHTSLRGCSLTTMELQPLRPEESRKLAVNLTGSTLGALEACVERSEGNPLFLEHLIHNSSEASTQGLPDTLHGLVLARVDRLPRADREAIQAASVLGQRFSPDALNHILGVTNYDYAGLLQHRIVRPEGRDFMFVHALVREGVYSSLLQTRQRDLHSQAAGFYEERDAVLHAEHLDRSASPGAPGAYLAAAREEAAQVRYEIALRLVARALEIVPDAEGFTLELLQGELLLNIGSVTESITAYRQALALAQGDSERCLALIGLSEGLRLKDKHAELLRTLDEAEAAAKAQNLSSELARILQLRSSVYFIRGGFDACLRANTASLRLAREVRSAQLEAQALGGLGEADFARGRMISAYKSYDECIRLGREHGFLQVVAANLSMRGQTLNYMNDLEAAMTDCRDAVELAAQIRRPRAEMVGAIVATYIAELNDPIEGEKWARSSLDIARRLGAQLFESMNLEYLGRFAGQLGDHVGAEKLVQEAIAIIRKSESGMRFLGGRTLGALALVTRDAERQRLALEEGEALLQRGAPAHNHLWFNRDAIEVCLQTAHWNRVEKYAKALEDYTSTEPLPWSDFFIARGRALAACGLGRSDDACVRELQRLRDEAKRVGLKNALPALEQTFASL